MNTSIDVFVMMGFLKLSTSKGIVSAAKLTHNRVIPSEKMVIPQEYEVGLSLCWNRGNPDEGVGVIPNK